MRKIIILIFILFLNFSAFAQTNVDTSFFDLNNIVDSILKYSESEQTNKQNELFIDATNKFQQGNVVSAYEKYQEFINITENDFGLLNLSKSLYEIGFFSLAENALSKITHKDRLNKHINDLKQAYKNSYPLTKDEEIYLAKAYASVNFYNLAQEVAYEFNQNNILQGSDWADFILAQAQVKTKQYKTALNTIEKAIKKNPDNNLYLSYKLKILIYQNDYKKALKFIKELEKNNLITTSFINDFSIQKKDIEKNLAKTNEDKLLRQIDIAYLENDTYSAIKYANEILEINKNSVNALTTLGFCELKLKNIEEAKKYAQLAYEINKKHSKTLELKGDIEFIDFKYLNALKYYQKSYSKDKNTLVLNKILLSSVFAKNNEAINKYMKIMEKNKSNQFLEFYDIAVSNSKYLPNEKTNLSNEYLKKSIVMNPFWEESWLEFAKNEIQKDKILFATNTLDSISINKKLGYNFYYVKALLEYKLGNLDETIKNLDYSVKLNPNFIPAKQLKDEISSYL
ncbi:MAG: hypothetical protein E7Z91_00950 [Cyanobacteria bacterium SIG30]|nr:hypothetical protein [Cyanobacteria bacterium SIG30]